MGGKQSRRQQPFSLRVDPEALAAYKVAAERAGMSTAEWARHVLDVSSGLRQIRHVYFMDVMEMSPEEATESLESSAKKVRTGKW